MDSNWKESFLHLYQKSVYEKDKGYHQNVFVNSLIETTLANEESLDPNEENYLSREIFYDKVRKEHHAKDTEAFVKMIKDPKFLPKTKTLNENTKFPSIEELKLQEPCTTIFTKVITFLLIFREKFLYQKKLKRNQK